MANHVSLPPTPHIHGLSRSLPSTVAIDPRDLAPLPVDVTAPAGDCISGISSGNAGTATEWLVGDVFLKNAYFSTDVRANTLSLAKFV